jgi:hypothetical protein
MSSKIKDYKSRKNILIIQQELLDLKKEVFNNCVELYKEIDKKDSIDKKDLLKIIDTIGKCFRPYYSLSDSQKEYVEKHQYEDVFDMF